MTRTSPRSLAATFRRPPCRVLDVAVAVRAKKPRHFPVQVVGKQGKEFRRLPSDHRGGIRGHQPNYFAKSVLERRRIEVRGQIPYHRLPPGNRPLRRVNPEASGKGHEEGKVARGGAVIAHSVSSLKFI